MDTKGSTIGMGFALGLALFVTTMFLGWLSVRYNVSANLLKWTVLPTVGFGIGMGLNSALQHASCGSVNPFQITKGSLAILGSILIFLLLTMISFIRSPIEAVVPTKYYTQWAGIAALSYYMFWAGMLGETIAGPQAQFCPQT